MFMKHRVIEIGVKKRGYQKEGSKNKSALDPDISIKAQRFA